MLAQFVIGIAVICLTAYIHACTLALAITKSKPLKTWAQRSPTAFRVSTALAVSVIWVMCAHLLEVIVWAGTFLLLGVFETMDTSVYFSLVAYTTLGFGDIILPEQWRILSGMVAANGFLVFGWSTAFQVDFLADLHRRREQD